MNFSPPGDASLMTQVTHRAMATEFVVILPPHQAAMVEPVVEALDELDRYEADLTIYQPGSEISRVNLLAAEQPVAVSAATFALVQKAVLWSRRTSGAFDITAGPLVEAWGFTRRDGRKPSSEEVEQARRRVGFQHLTLNETDQTIQFDRPGMSINMGGIGKGDALDRIARQLRGQGLTDFLLHGGSSSVIAVGDQVQGSDQGWPIGIAHPTKPNRRLGGIWLRNRALATSGSGKQFFHHRGRRYGHVIDPRTGYPAGDLLALTVIMPSAADADACSTGFFVGGHDSIAPQADWTLPDMITVAAGDRQDETVIEITGDVKWVDQPGGEAPQTRPASS